jgi:hypothetical protein
MERWWNRQKWPRREAMRKACMKVVILLAITLGLLAITSCTRTQTDFNSFAHKSERFRVLLIEYYALKGHFPSEPDSLKELDPTFNVEAGGVWNGWRYTAFDQPHAFNIWGYAGRTRQSLWLKFNATNASETGWFTCNDNGKFIPQAIPLLPEEQDLLNKQ